MIFEKNFQNFLIYVIKSNLRMVGQELERHMLRRRALKKFRSGVALRAIQWVNHTQLGWAVAVEQSTMKTCKCAVNTHAPFTQILSLESRRTVQKSRFTPFNFRHPWNNFYQHVPASLLEYLYWNYLISNPIKQGWLDNKIRIFFSMTSSFDLSKFQII